MGTPNRPIRIFVCYAPEDEPLLRELEKQLRLLRRQGLIEVWHDREISPGANWEQEIAKYLNTADVILLLVSPEFFDSDYCFGVEMQRAMERHEQGEARVIPIILRQVHWRDAPFGKIQALPTGAKPVTGSGWQSQEEAFYDVAEGIRKVLNRRPLRPLERNQLAEQPHLLDEDFDKALEQVRQPRVPQGITLLSYRGYTGGANMVVWSPKGRRIASASNDGTVRIWDVTTGANVRTFDNHSLEVKLVAWSPDGTRIASASKDRTVRVWDARTGTTLVVYRDHFDDVNVIAWSPDSTRIASASRVQFRSRHQTVRVWDAKTGITLVIYRDHSGDLWDVNTITWSPDGTHIISSSEDTKVWNAVTGVTVAKKSLSGNVALSPDGTHIASRFSSGLDVWDTMTGANIATYKKHKGQIRDLAWSPDGTHIASASGDSVFGVERDEARAVHVWDAATGASIHTYDGHSGWVTVVAWSPDGTHIATGSVDKTVQVWEVSKRVGLLNKVRVVTYPHHSCSVDGVAWSPDGKYIASVNSQELLIWDASTGKNLPLQGGHLGLIETVVWSPDGMRIASSGYKTIQIWDATTGTLLKSFGNSSYSVNLITWSPDGTRIALSSKADSLVQVWDITTGAVLLENPHNSLVNTVSWSPDGMYIASASDKTVRVWDARTGAILVVYNDHFDDVNMVAWSPDSTRIASASDDETVRVWYARTGTTLVTYYHHSDSDLVEFKKVISRIPNLMVSDFKRQGNEVEVVAWSPDGRCIASSSWDKAVQVWDAKTAATIATYNGHSSPVLAVAWSPDSTQIASIGHNDNKVQIWNVTTRSCTSIYDRHCSDVFAIAWSPDGTCIASAGYGVQIWQAS